MLTAHYQVPIKQSVIFRNESNVEKFSNIKQRIIKDKKLVEKTCAKYLGSQDPWLPVKLPRNRQCQGMCYYIDEDNKRGYCINKKVTDYHLSKSLIIY